MVSSLWEATKINQMENMKENFQFLTFVILNALFTLENLPLLTFWATFLVRKYE